MQLPGSNFRLYNKRLTGFVSLLIAFRPRVAGAPRNRPYR